MFDIEFTPEADSNIDGFSKNDQKRLLDHIGEQLTHEPGGATSNRKRLRPNELAEWELRLDRFRVFYDIDGEKQMVTVVAIGLKEGNRLTIGGREFKL